MPSDDVWNITDDDFDLANWKPWGDYPESSDNVNTKPEVSTIKPELQATGPGEIKQI